MARMCGFTTLIVSGRGRSANVCRYHTGRSGVGGLPHGAKRNSRSTDHGVSLRKGPPEYAGWASIEGSERQNTQIRVLRAAPGKESRRLMENSIGELCVGEALSGANCQCDCSRRGTGLREDLPDLLASQGRGQLAVLVLREPIDCLGEESLFRIEDMSESLFDRGPATETIYPDFAPLANAYDTVTSLIVGRRIPPLVKKEDMISLN